MSSPTQTFAVPGQAYTGQLSQGFPPPLGIEQGFGATYGQAFAPAYGQAFGYGYGQPAGAAYGQHLGALGGQFAPFGTQLSGVPYQQLQLITQQIAGQILSAVYQTVASQVMQQVPQLAAHLAAHPAAQYGYQQPAIGWSAAARPFPF
jgi:hypothetical protein